MKARDTARWWFSLLEGQKKTTAREQRTKSGFTSEGNEKTSGIRRHALEGSWQSLEHSQSEIADRQSLHFVAVNFHS
jgi:hypothetical protein